MKNSLGQPQSVLVLGGSSDIAKATVKRLIAQRCRRVLLAGRRQDELDSAANEILSSIVPTLNASSPAPEISGSLTNSIPEVFTGYFDAFDRKNHHNMIEECFSKLGQIDLVVIAFGLLGDENLDDPSSVLNVIDTNYSGVVSCLLQVAHQLKTQGGGEIVVLSSVAGVRVRESNLVYGSSKAAIDSFCQGFAEKIEGDGIRLHIVRPGFIHTKMTRAMKPSPLSRQPEDVANAIVQTLGTDKVIIWVPPAIRLVFMILQALPRSIFRKLPI